MIEFCPDCSNMIRGPTCGCGGYPSTKRAVRSNMKTNIKYKSIPTKPKLYVIEDILPEGFWDAFLKGNYPSDYEGELAFNIENYADLIKGYGYAHSIYNTHWDFYVNIMAIKNICYISLHPTFEPNTLLGVIVYFAPKEKKGRQEGKEKKKKAKKCYYSSKMQRNPKAFSVLNHIGTELFNEIRLTVKDVPRLTGNLPFPGVINKIVCCAKWQELIEINPTADCVEKAEFISNMKELNLVPISVAQYTSYSHVVEVSSEANRAHNIISESIHDIERRFLEISKNNPNMEGMQIIKQIADEDDIEAITIAGMGRNSPHPVVKKKCIKNYNILWEKKHDITGFYIELKEQYTDWSTKEIFRKIAEIKGLSLISVAHLGTISSDEMVKIESRELFYQLNKENNG